MSLVTLIRDYVDVANSTEQLDGYTLSSLASHTIILLFTVAKEAAVYCFTFHWLRDLSYFCFTPPLLLSSFANVGEVGKLLGVENQPLSHLLAFSDFSFSTGIGIVFLGFVNGCFSSMHLSAAHLVSIQRMLVQGVPAGICSALGTAFGQIFFIACILFGFRGLLFPWLALEPLQFLVGTGIILSLASTMAQDRRTPTIQWSAKSSLLSYACTSAALAWCEQTAMFQWMGNISFGAEPTFLESTPSLGVGESVNSTLVPTLWGTFGTVQHLVQNISYLLAFFLGSVIGAFLIGFLLQRFLELILRYKKIAVYYGLVKQANLPLATLIFAFGFGSIPYYGFDYLVTKGFGFVPHESFFKQTLFSPINLVSKTSQAKDSSQSRLEDQLALLFTLEGEKSKSFAVDTTPFDDGQYLKSSQKRPQAFEDLNYRGEHLWTNRLSRISNIREQANQTQSSFLGPVFSWMRSFLWGDGSITTNTNPNVDRFTTTLLNKNMAVGESDKDWSPLTSKGDHRGDTVTSSEIVDLPPEAIFVNKSSGIGTSSSSQVQSNEFQGTSTFVPSISTNVAPVTSSSSFASIGSVRKKELSSEMEQVDNYLKEFDRQFDKGFSNFYDVDPHSLIEVEDQWQEKRIKEKCYTNPIYKFLLNTEIDAFLARQPNSHWLSSQEEILLLKRRQLLGNYYDTLALTSQVSTSEALEQLVPKSYANAIYNHQFKGTLKTARRLFSVKKANTYPSSALKTQRGLRAEQELQGEVNRKELLNNSSLSVDIPRLTEQEQTRIVKFDQPLFSKDKDPLLATQQILFHEELSVDSLPQRNTKLMKTEELRKKMGAFKEKEVTTKASDKKNIFSLEQAESTPLYAGWDEQLRKFVLTNRYQNRALAGYMFSEYPERLPVNSTKNNYPLKPPVTLQSSMSNKGARDKTSNPPGLQVSGVRKKTTVFTTWPIPNPLTQNVNKSLISFIDEDSFLDTKESSQNGVLDSSLHSSKVASGDTVPKSDISQESPNTRFVDTSSIYPLPLIPQKGVSSNNKVGEQKENGSTTFLLNNKFLKSTNHFLFQPKPATNDMVNALLQWQKLIKENKQLSKEDKEISKEKVSYWPENIRRANWSNELLDNDIEFDEPTENVFKKKTFLWEFTPPSHGGFIWSSSN